MIETQNISDEFGGNGVTTEFPTNVFSIEGEQIYVYLISAEGVETLLELTTDYTLFNLDNTFEEGVRVVCVTPPAVGETLRIVRDTLPEQTLNITEARAFDPVGLERQLDKLTMGLQEVRNAAARSLRARSFSSDFNPLDDHVLVYRDGAFASGPSMTEIADAAEAGELAQEAGAQLGSLIGTEAYDFTIVSGNLSGPYTITLPFGLVGVAEVHVGGAWLPPSEYAFDGTNLTFTSPRRIGEQVYLTFNVSVPYDPNVNRVEAFESRPALITHIGLNGATAGHSYHDGMNWYFAPPVGHVYFGINPIPDALGLIPRSEITPEHFGSVDGTNDEIQVNLAVVWADTVGGDVVWARGQYFVEPSGTWSVSNGDLNSCIRLETTNRVELRGVPGLSEITQAGVRISHVVSLGRRVGTSLPANGKVHGFRIFGNRTTAVDEGVPFAGGMGIMVAGPGTGVEVTGNYIKDSYAYGIGFQRAWWHNCLCAYNWIETPGNDGIDAKYDYLGDTGSDPAGTLEAGYATNWVQYNFVDRPAQNWATLVGQKAGIDIRNGWNSQGNLVLINAPSTGIRFQGDDETVLTPELGMGSLAPDSDPATMRYFMSGVSDRVFFLAGGTLSGNDGAATSMEAKGFQIGTWRPHVYDAYAYGCVQNFWIRSDQGRYFGLTGRGATGINLAVYGTGGTGINGNEFHGIDMSGAPVDVRIYGTAGNLPSKTKFFGGDAADIVQIDAGVVNTALIGLEYTTLNDTGTNTLRLRAGDVVPLAAGRNGTQYLLLEGDGSGNYITGIGGSKPTILRGGAGATTTIVDAPTGQVVSLRIAMVEQVTASLTGLNLPVGKVVSVAGTKVLAARKTGWTTPTGTATRTTFDTATVTTAQLAERVKALIDDLHATAGHGIIGT